METTFQVSKEGDADKITIVGPINEDSELQLATLHESIGNNVIINFKQVTFINSLGVRAWINFMRQMENRSLVFEECTAEIVNQINMIPNFKGNAQIKSVYGSYYCDDCGHTQNVIFEAGSTLPTTSDIHMPEVKCEKCGSEETEFEEVEEAFFAFSIAS